MDLGGIQRIVQIWIHGDQTSATFTVDNGTYSLDYVDENGKEVHQIGNITMDQMMFDISGVEAEVGDVITLLDEEDLSLDNWAELLGTINYELTCRLKVRLPRIYTR